MITLKNVSKWYGHFQVLTDCSTEVKKGEVVVVCGPSGSGKSTLIKTVNGLEPVQQGEITVDGIVVNDRKPIWQSCVPRRDGIPAFELFPHLSIIENLTLAQVKVLKRDKAPAREKALKLLERVELPRMPINFRRSFRRSAAACGNRSRVVYGSSCDAVRRTDMALDPEMIDEVLDVMVELANEGMTMMVVTHEWVLPVKWRIGSSLWTRVKLSKTHRKTLSSIIRNRTARKTSSRKSCINHSGARTQVHAVSRFIVSPLVSVTSWRYPSQRSTRQGATMALPILLDCDPGHDDAIAIVLALASPELDVKAITSSAGNRTPEKTLRNVLRMLTLLNRTDIPVAGGAVKPLMRELIIADNVHGESGLDGPALPEPTFAPQNCRRWS